MAANRRLGEGHALHNLGRVYLEWPPEEAITGLTEALLKHEATGDLAARRWRGSPWAGAGRDRRRTDAPASLAARYGYSSSSASRAAETVALLASLSAGAARDRSRRRCRPCSAQEVRTLPASVISPDYRSFCLLNHDSHTIRNSLAIVNMTRSPGAADAGVEERTGKDNEGISVQLH